MCTVSVSSPDNLVIDRGQIKFLKYISTGTEPIILLSTNICVIFTEFESISELSNSVKITPYLLSKMSITQESIKLFLHIYQIP